MPLKKLLLCLSVFCAAAIGASREPRFSGRQDFAFGPGAHVAAGDLNGNGIGDFVAVSGGGVQSFLGNGSGRFRPGPSSSLGSVLVSTVLLADLKGNRKPDLLYLSQIWMCVAENQGKGVFQAGVCYGGYDHTPGNIVTGDFNGDGITDAVIPGGQGIWFFPGRRNGKFGKHVLSPVGVFHSAFAATADLNGDGKLDLVLAPRDKLYVLFGNGDGTFQSPVSLTVPKGNRTVFIGDLNQDGHPDFVTNSGGIITIYLNNGSGGFTQSSTFSSPCQPTALGDVTGDHIPDLVCDGSGFAYVYPALGNGQFGQPSAFPIETSVADSSIALAPLTKNGALGIIVGQNNGISVLLNNGKGKFADGTWINVPGSGDCGAAADFNGDGKPDLAVIDSQGITILLGTGKATEPFTTGPTIPVSGPGCPVAGDLNGDGIADILVGADGLGGVGAYLGNGDGTFRLAGVNSDVGPCFNIVLGDLNHDGILDFATSGNQMALGKGDGTFQGATVITNSPPPACCNFVAMGDVNNDGWPDILLAAGLSFGIELNNLQGGFSSSDFNIPEGGAYAIDLADLNRDGNLDIVAMGSDGFDILLGDGQGGFTLFQQYLRYPGPDVLLPWVADVNGDGIPDVLLPANASIGVAIGNGDGTFQPEVAFGAGPGEGRILTMNLRGQSPNAGLPDIVAPDGTGIGVVVLVNRTK